MHEIYLTVRGNLASDVSYRVLGDGTAVASFRVASSASRVDGSGQWQQTDRAYFDVTAWRRAAENVRDCLARGLPVLVHGRFRVRQVSRVGPDGRSVEHSYNCIEAASLGLDLTRCRAMYERSPVGPQLNPVSATPPGPSPAVQADTQQPAGPPDGEHLPAVA